jgi:phosphate acetyltransferase
MSITAVVPESEVLATIRDRARLRRQRVIFPEQGDPRVQDAVWRIAADNLCQPVFFEPGVGDECCEIFWDRADANEWFERAVAHYAARMKNKGFSEQDARNQLRDPLLLATTLVRIGYVDSGVAGSVASTADVLRACLRGIGLAPDSHLVSSIFVMDHHHRLMSFGDCAVNPSPDAAQLAQIAIDSAATHRVLTGHEARVALLSFSTHGSAEHEDVDKVREALAIIRQRAPDMLVCGELQLDAALIPEIGEAKASTSPVAGNANVLIFPDLNSGNIGYKIAERLGGAHAIGPVLQGLDKPWLDLSRGCNANDIVNAAAIAAVLAGAS